MNDADTEMYISYLCSCFDFLHGNCAIQNDKYLKEKRIMNEQQIPNEHEITPDEAKQRRLLDDLRKVCINALEIAVCINDNINDGLPVPDPDKLQPPVQKKAFVAANGYILFLKVYEMVALRGRTEPEAVKVIKKIMVDLKGK